MDTAASANRRAGFGSSSKPRNQLARSSGSTDIANRRAISEPQKLRLLITVTLNPNQLRSHVEPLLALDEVESAILVADRAGPSLPKLRTVVPPRALTFLCGRALAKLIVCLRLARRDRPDVVLAYNLVPHALNAAFVAKRVKTRSAFHLIGGHEEWLGGGWRSDNNVLGRMPRPSPMLERLLLRVIRSFDAVATMGPSGRASLLERGVDPRRVIELPAAVDLERFKPAGSSEPTAYDLVAVTSLIPRKRPWDLLAIADRLRAERPGLRMAVLGTGALLDQLKGQAAALGLEETVEFLGFRERPEDVVARSRVFVLTSRHEGLSIALTEAMAAGVPPVVTDVGETGSLVVDGVSGYLWEVGDVTTASERIAALLNDETHRRSMGAEAARSVAQRVRFGAIVDGSRELLKLATA